MPSKKQDALQMEDERQWRRQLQTMVAEQVMNLMASPPPIVSQKLHQADRLGNL